MVFLLNYEHRNDGTTVIQYDDGPARRIQLVTLTESAHVALATDPNQLLEKRGQTGASS